MPYVKETLNVVDLGRPLHAGCLSLPRQGGTFPLVLPSCCNCLPAPPVSVCFVGLGREAGLYTAGVGRFRRRTLISGGIPAKPEPTAEVLASASQQQRPTPPTICPKVAIAKGIRPSVLSSKLGAEKRKQSPTLMSSSSSIWSTVPNPSRRW